MQTPEEAASIKAKVLAYVSAVQAKEAGASTATSPGLSTINPTGEAAAEKSSQATAGNPMVNVGSAPSTDIVPPAAPGDAPQ